MYQVSLIVRGKRAKDRMNCMYFGNITAAIYNTHRAKDKDPITWKDVYPDETKFNKIQTVNEMQDIAKAITKALGGTIK